MIRTLMIMRHAQGFWTGSDIPDNQRPLSSQGKKEALMMGELLKSQGYQCDLMISSPAMRTLETAQEVAEQMGYNKPIIEKEQLYSCRSKSSTVCELSDFMQVVHSIDPEIKHAMIVGHSPVKNFKGMQMRSMEKLLQELANVSFKEFPSAACALLEFKGPWETLSHAKLLRFACPQII